MQCPISERSSDDTNFSSLIERVKAGDREALQDLIVHYRPLLYTVISKQQVTERSRNDRIHDAHLKLLEALRTGKIPPLEGNAKVFSYLKTLFNNVCNDEARERKTKRNGGNRKREDFTSSIAAYDPGQASPSRLAMGRELLEEIRSHLTYRELQVLDLMIDATTLDATGIKPKEIARRLGISQNAAYQIIHKIRSKCLNFNETL